MDIKRSESTIQDHVTDKLRQAIFQGTFKYGERLIQEQWAEKLGVSRMPIREALKQLEIEGLVRIEPRKGAIVTPLTTNDIKEIYTLRSFLEGVAVERALPYITEQDEIKLEEILLKMENLTVNEKNIEYYIELNNQYHKKLREKCPWSRIKQQIDMLWLGFLPFASPNLLKDCYDLAKREHRMIFEAVKSKDPVLVQSTVQYHVNRNKSHLLSIMNDTTFQKS